MTDTRIVDLFGSVFGSAFGEIDVTCERNGERRVMSVASIASREGGLWATVQTVFFDPSGAVLDARHDPTYLGPLDDVPGLATVDEASLRACIPAIHDAARLWLEKIDDRNHIALAFPLRVVHFAALWAHEGPTPERPERFAEAESIAARLANDIEILRPGDDGFPDVDDAVFAIAVRGWTLAFVIADVDGRVILTSPEGVAAEVMRLGIDGNQSLCAYPFDGDTVTQRGVYEILALATLIAEKDEPIADPEHDGEDDDDDLLPDTSIAVYLLFRAGEEPQLDWRLQGDSIGEGPLRDGFDPALRAKHTETAALFDRFVRSVIDERYEARAAG